MKQTEQIESIQTPRGTVKMFKERGAFSGTNIFFAETGPQFIGAEKTQAEMHQFIKDWGGRQSHLPHAQQNGVSRQKVTKP